MAPVGWSLWDVTAMLAFNIGWQEVLLILLFLLGFIVIPLPGRWMRRAAAAPVRFSEQFLAAPIDTIHAAAEAFFCSYPEGEYTLVGKERFRLTFRRGRQTSEDDGQIVLSLRGHDELPDDLPTVLRVLLQPRADALMITMKQEIRLRGSAASGVRKRLAADFRHEVRDFQVYLRENFGSADASAPLARPVKHIDTVRRKD